MRWQTRRRLWTVMAVLAVLAAGAKLFKAAYRGETIQSRVQPIR